MFSCRQPLPWHIPPTSPAASYDPRLLPKVSLHRGALHRVSLRDLETFHKCNAMTLFFSRYPEASLTLPYRSCLHCRVVQVLEVLQELPSHGSRRGRARALVDTGTTPTHTPPYSYAHASFGLAHAHLQTVLPTDLHNVLVVQRPRPPSAPASTSRVSIPDP